MNLLIYSFIFLLISFSTFGIDTKATNAIVVDYDTKEILYKKNENQKVPPASMTKIMTVYVAFDRLKNTDLSIQDICIISPKAYKMGGSRTFLEIDDQVTIDDLLKGIIVQSGNDASIALAECLAGTEKDFVLLMNNYSSKLGMNNSNFTNSSGWPDDKHFSSVKDISILTNALIKDFPNMYNYFNLKNFTYNQINQPNRNKLLTKFKGADGLKTGYTKKSGWGIAASAIRDDRRITVVINGTNSSRSRLNESANLLNWAFLQTSKKILLNKNQIIETVDVWLGNKPTINLISEDIIYSILSFDQIQLIKSKITYQKPIVAPIKKGEKIGEMQINISGKIPLSVPLVAQNDVKKINPFMRIFAAFKYLIFGTSLEEL